MNKSDLVEKIAAMQGEAADKQGRLSDNDIAFAVDFILEQMSKTLSGLGRIEIREFGSFNIHRLAPRRARNPKTGTPVMLGYRYIPRFKPGRRLKQGANETYRKSSKKRNSQSQGK